MRIKRFDVAYANGKPHRNGTVSGANPTTTHIEYWRIPRLRDYERNPRKNDHAVDAMLGSIREYGFAIPVLARTSGEVVDGHFRLKAARKLGMWIPSLEDLQISPF